MPFFDGYAVILVLSFTSIILFATSLIFMTLYGREWNQRIREEKEHDVEMAEIITDYEQRMTVLERTSQSNHDFIEMLVQKHPLISPEIKDALIEEWRQYRTRHKLPREVEEEQQKENPQ